MGWFDEQIKQRKHNDDMVFSEAFYEIAGKINGKKIFFDINDDRKVVKNAIDEVLKYYNVKSRELPHSITDTDAQLEYLMRPYGIMRRNVKLDTKWYKHPFGAMLAKRTDDNSIVALIPHFLGYYFWDTKNNERVKVTKHNESLFERDAICFYKPFPLEKLSQKELFRQICRTISLTDIIYFALLTFFVALLGMLLPLLYNIIFSSIIIQDSLKPLLSITIFMICQAISVGIITAAKDITAAKIQSKIKLSVESAIMMRILSLPSVFFKKYSSGDLASRVQSADSLCKMLIETLLSTGLTAVFALVYAIQIFIYAKNLAVPALVVVAASVVLSLIVTYIQTKIGHKQMENSAHQQGMSYSLITGIQKIKLAGAEKRAFARWGKTYAQEAGLLYNPPLIIRLSTAISAAISIAGSIWIFYTAVQSHISTASYYAFNSAYGMMSGAFMAFAGASVTIAGIKPALQNLQPIFDTVPEIDSQKQVVTRLSGGIELNNINFRYTDNTPNVIDNLSLKIRPGQYVAIVGTTGCGKSTLMKLMLGFEKPQKGAVYFDGQDLSKLDLKSLRQKIGVVMQDGKLFAGDIFSNISISTPNLTLDEAWQAAEMAGIAEDIRNMPMGMHTYVSEGSGGISGGQRQRILIARAIASNPKILMFDEATSALDNITQKIVSDSLNSLKCTRIVIAHRLSTIKQCNRIIVLDNGKIAEDGDYQSLMDKNGLFSELVSQQKLS